MTGAYDHVISALRDCVFVMERDLYGLQLIQPELAKGKKALADLEAVNAEPAQWNGEGLPPVGTVCEYYADEDTWRRCEIVAYKDGMAVVWVNHAHIWSCSGAGLRPLRTPEQIAAEEREKAIAEMVEAVQFFGNIPAASVFAFCGILHDAGYQKTTE